jgi:hypothetical protein
MRWHAADATLHSKCQYNLSRETIKDAETTLKLFPVLFEKSHELSEELEASFSWQKVWRGNRADLSILRFFSGQHASL